MKERIINSILWTDLYKLTMGQGVFHNYPEVGAVYEFINRGKHKFPEGFGEKLKEQVGMMSGISLSPSDREFLEKKCPYLQKDYLDWFSSYRFNPDEVEIKQDGEDLDIGIRGPWVSTIYWEVPLMALICELYYKETGQKPDAEYIVRARQKGESLRNAQALLLEFGTRRAFSHEVQRNVLEALIETARLLPEGGVLLGTSNVALAKEFDLNPSGTYAHEWVMGHAALFGNLKANEKAMEVWAKEYLGLDGGTVNPKLGTALTDTYTTEVFMRSFNEKFALLYSFLRQDSGNPFVQGEKLVALWQKFFENPKEAGKGVVFSDGLDTQKVLDLHDHFSSGIIDVYGVGTHLSNDVGCLPLNIVIKMFGVEKNGLLIPVAKLSDNEGKESGDPAAVEKAKTDFGLRRAA